MIPRTAQRLILRALLLLTTEALLISGRGASSELMERDVQLRRQPQVYGLYVEPSMEVGSNIRDRTSEKRSRLFVGKRFPAEEGGQDYIVLSSSDGGSTFVGEEFKRNHLFVGKRGSPRFVGKRSVAGMLNRAKRFAQSEEFGVDSKDPNAESENDDYTWKMGDGENASDEVKRSRMFVGKRRDSDELEEITKRSRLFVGRRGGQQPDKETEHTAIAYPAEGVAVETDKRSRLFVGKRPGSFQRHHPIGKFSGGEDQKTNAEKGENVDNIQSPETSRAQETDKRPRLFPGKRPAPGFVGKRET